MAACTRDARWRSRGKPTKYRNGQPTSSADPAFLLKDLEEQVATLSVDSDGCGSELVPRLRHVKPVTSYSWIDAAVPTIVVPGSPRIWVGEVKQVPLDAGVQYIHHDASKMGDLSPLLPAFAAIDAMHDDFAYAELDLATDRNALRKLLRHVDGVRIEGRDDFRIDVDLVGKTCVFTRREAEMTLVGQHTGYGHEYLKTATRVPAGCAKMVDHHRIVTYEFGSMNVLLGFTADACIENKAGNDAVLATFSSLSLSDDADKMAKPNKLASAAGLTIKHAPSRSLIPQSDVIEVKTRSVYREPNWREIYPQVYLSQTPWLYMAKHTSGVFQPVEKIGLTGEEMRPYAEMLEGSLVKLKDLLEEILKAVREQGECVPLSLVRQGGTLLLWRRKAGTGKPLGEHIRSKFKRVGAPV